MKVKELISVLSKTEKVLKLYENKTVDEMIEDIYSQLCPTNIEEKSSAKSNNTSSGNIVADANTYKKIINEIKYKEKQEIIEYMQKLKKNDLMSIAKLLNIKLNKSSKKDIMIESVASYFSFINLNQKVSEREEEELQKFINLNS